MHVNETTYLSKLYVRVPVQIIALHWYMPHTLINILSKWDLMEEQVIKYNL